MENDLLMRMRKKNIVSESRNKIEDMRSNDIGKAIRKASKESLGRY